MKPTSKYFDSIRIKRGEATAAKPIAQACQWKGCKLAGNHRAPKGRGRDGEFYAFCMDHVRQFNATYNYFDGMSDVEVEDFQKSSITGHRPTWKLGENAAAAGREAPNGSGGYARFARDGGADPHDLLQNPEESGSKSGKAARRGLKPLERKALELAAPAGDRL